MTPYTRRDRTSAIAALPRTMIRWALAAAATLAALTAGAPDLAPTWSLAAAVATGAASAARDPTRAAASLVAVLGSAAAAAWLSLEPGWVATAVAGVWLARGGLVPADALDHLHGGLLGFAGAALSGAAADAAGAGGAGLALVAALGAAAAAWPVAWRHDHPPPPSPRTIRAALDEAHRGPAHRAAQLYAHAAPLTPDVASRRRLHEACTWVLRLQARIQGLEVERARLRTVTSREPTALTARLAASAAALDAALASSRALVQEALDLLEESRVVGALGRVAADEQDRVAALLADLHAHAAEGRARHAADQELTALRT